MGGGSLTPGGALMHVPGMRVAAMHAAGIPLARIEVEGSV